MVELVQLLLGGEGGHIHLVAHGVSQNVGDAVHQLHLLAILLHDGLVAVDEGLAVPPPGEGAESVGAALHGGAVESDHVRPNLVHVGGVGKVHHIRAEPAARAHVHLQGYHIPLFAHALLILGEAEELKVDEPALHPEGLHGGPTGFPGVGGQVLDRKSVV